MLTHGFIIKKSTTRLPYLASVLNRSKKTFIYVYSYLLRLLVISRVRNRQTFFLSIKKNFIRHKFSCRLANYFIFLHRFDEKFNRHVDF